MEGTHTVLCLHKPIQEFSHISLYFPTGRVRGFTYGSRAPRDCQPLYTNQHDQGDEDPARAKQRGQSYKPAGDTSQSCDSIKGVLAELQWLSAEHWQLLVDLLSLCGDCAARVKMGNQDGKFPGQPEAYAGHLLHDLSSSNLQHALLLSPEHKRAASRVRKLKKLAGKKTDSAEEFLQSKMSKKVQSITASELPQTHLDAVSVVIQTAGQTPLFNAGSGSYASVGSEPLLPMEGPFQTAQEGWDFMEDSRPFDSEIDLCTELTEFEDQFSLSYGASTCTFMDNVQGQIQMAGGNNIRPSRNSSYTGNEDFEEKPEGKTAARLYDHINRRDMTESQKMDSAAQRNSCLETKEASSGAVEFMPYTSKDSSVMGHNICQHLDHEEMRAFTENYTQRKETESNMGDRYSEAMRIPLSSLAQAQSGVSNLRPWTKSPTSPSLSGIFNVSFPPTNSLQSMSPVLSPLSSRLSSPQLNHRIVLLPEQNGGKEKDRAEATGSWSESVNQPKVTTEVIDKNGNRRTITRLDLNLSRQGTGNSTWSTTGTSGSTTTEDHLLRQDDVWLLEGDDSVSHEPLCRATRPDRLDFLRITPPEDDIIGDTPYHPKPELTVSETRIMAGDMEEKKHSGRKKPDMKLYTLIRTYSNP
ncbi:hypothetical protein SRHO_G00132360 [Serrasalmus rhombeus]